MTISRFAELISIYCFHLNVSCFLLLLHVLVIHSSSFKPSNKILSSKNLKPSPTHSALLERLIYQNCKFYFYSQE